MTEYLNSFVNQNYEGDSNDLNEMLASTAISMSDLDAMKSDIGEAAYNKQKTVLEAALAEAQLTEQYHEEEKALEGISSKLQKIAKLKSSASGVEYLKLIEEENKLLAE
jgi:hypothetical protein